MLLAEKGRIGWGDAPASDRPGFDSGSTTYEPHCGFSLLVPQFPWLKSGANVNSSTYFKGVCDD